MKKYLFPFSVSYKNFSKYWWHRLFVVIFIISVTAIGIYVWRSSLNYEINGYSNCYQFALKYPIYSSVNQGGCAGLYPIHWVLDFLIGLFSALISFYFFQILYYKFFLYIIFGKNKTI